MGLQEGKAKRDTMLANQIYTCGTSDQTLDWQWLPSSFGLAPYLPPRETPSLELLGVECGTFCTDRPPSVAQ